MHLVIETWQLEDRQVVVPELDASVEDEPALSGLLAQTDRRNDVVQELLFLLRKLLLLLWRELAFILVVLDGNQLGVTDLDLLFEQEFDLDLGKVNVGPALRNDQVGVLLGVPLVLGAQSGCIISDLD